MKRRLLRLFLRLRRRVRRPWVGGAVLLAAVGALVSTCSLLSPPTAAAVPELDVALRSSTDSLELRLDGAYTVYGPSGRVLAQGSRLRPGVVHANGGDIHVNGVRFPGPAVAFVPEDGSLFQIEDRRYGGTLRVRATGRDTLDVENRVDLESYVAGVLFAEMPAYFPEEALKAQAVASRTYAVWKLERGESLLRSDELDQVYAGQGPEPAKAAAIVAATRGQVLELDQRAVPALFSSTCGGATAAVEDVFGDANAALVAVRCTYCSDSPLYRWHRSLPLDELARRLGQAGPLEGLRVRRDGHGRSLQIRVQSAGKETEYDTLRFRALWNAGGGETLPSGNFQKLEIRGGRLELDGAGFGHGVGFCQYGAGGLARGGKSYREILRHYYGAATLVRRW